MNQQLEFSNDKTTDENFEAVQGVMLPMDTTRFTANGREYLVLDRIPTIARHVELQALEHELAYGYSVADTYTKLGEIKHFINGRQDADASITIHELQERLRTIHNRTNVMYSIAALFIVTADEDTSKFDESLVKRKLEDWSIARIEPTFFFQRAILSTKALTNIWLQDTPVSSPEPGNENENTISS